jgi:transcriptional regulator
VADRRREAREHSHVRHNRFHAETNPAIVRRLIAENPRATLVSHPDGEIVAAHYPVLLDEASDGLAS